MSKSFAIPTIAVDGFPGTNRAAIARELSKSLGMVCWDAGSFYRAFAYAVHMLQMDPTDAVKCTNLAESLKFTCEGGTVVSVLPGLSTTRVLRKPEVNTILTIVSRHAGVRAVLTFQIRREVLTRGGVVHGYDTTTAVMSDAKLKLILVAEAFRRADRLRYKGESSLTLEKLSERDALDVNTTLGTLVHEEPLVVKIDTTYLDVEEVVTEAVVMWGKPAAKRPGHILRPSAKSDILRLPRSSALHCGFLDPDRSVVEAV